jgi:hypothetical protein
VDEQEITADNVREIATFGAARGVAVDPSGRLYVADGRASTVVVLTPGGRVEHTLGGAGTGAGQFDGPADVDPTNGLSLWVADAGNGRLQHFSENLRFLESLPVGRVDPASGPQSRQPVFDVGRDGADVRAEGEPVSVATTSANELFAVDARQSVVVKWDAQRRPERVVGGFQEREGALQAPVALALDDTRLYVADRARGAVLVYDLFGTYRRALRLSEDASLGDVQSLTVHRGRLWIVTSTHLHAVTPQGEPVRSIPVTLPSPLVDAAFHDGRVFLLTTTRLVEVGEKVKGSR